MTHATEGFLVHFPTTHHPPVHLPPGLSLVHHLTPENSPVLFGCRTGVCGTCLVAIRVANGQLDPPGQDEAELLSVLCPHREDARLACQLNLTADIGVAPVSLAA